jgi:hypothetical protein
MMHEKYLWLVVPHNCVNFVETVIQAGGSNAGSWTNLPTLERIK